MGTTSEWRCEVADDNSMATVLITPPTEGNPYVVEDVVAFLRQNGVSGGIIFSEIEKMIRTGMYYKDVVVARGSMPVDGTDGYYEFLFDVGQIKHPEIRSDGSVDYQSMSIIHSVKEGDVLAIYHPAVKGSHGIDVRGRELRCRLGKELPEIRGTGFEICSDRVTYKATAQGRVEYDNYKMFVRDVYELRGDLDLITGRVDFLGDVIIHGNVRAGTMVRSSKSITVEGNVEAAVLIAEGDIVLKKGMQGGKRAKLVSGGDIYAYFLEYTEVTAKGKIEANIILNCKVTSGKAIEVKGKRGLIVGGSFSAANLISSNNIGNQAQLKTYVNVGLSAEKDERHHMLMTKYEAAKKGIESAKQEITSLNDVRLNHDPKDVREAKVSQMRRRLKRDERLLEHIEKELDELNEVMELSRNASVIAQGMAFGGVVVRIDDKEMIVERPYEHVKFVRNGVLEDISVESLY